MREHRLAGARLAGEHVQARGRGASSARSIKSRFSTHNSLSTQTGVPVTTDGLVCHASLDRARVMAGESIIWVKLKRSADGRRVHSTGSSAWLPATPRTRSTAPKRLHVNACPRWSLATRLDEEIRRRGAPPHPAELPARECSTNVERLANTHGEDLPEQALAYLGTALTRELRRFDRVGHAGEGELLVVLPGRRRAARRRSSRGARSAGCARSRSSSNGKRQPLRISVGIAAWRDGLQTEHLLAQTRIAAQRRRRMDPREHEPAEAPPAGTERDAVAQTFIISARALRV